MLTRTDRGGCRVGCSGFWFDIYDDVAIEKYCPLTIAQILRRRRNDLHRWANMPSAGDLLLFGERVIGSLRECVAVEGKETDLGPIPERVWGEPQPYETLVPLA